MLGGVKVELDLRVCHRFLKAGLTDWFLNLIKLIDFVASLNFFAAVRVKIKESLVVFAESQLTLLINVTEECFTWGV